MTSLRVGFPDCRFELCICACGEVWDQRAGEDRLCLACSHRAKTIIPWDDPDYSDDLVLT